MLWSDPNPIPKCEISPNVGFSPSVPQNAAGIRIDPPWSPPNEMSTSPAATAAPEPDDEPPVTCSRLCGLSGRP